MLKPSLLNVELAMLKHIASSTLWKKAVRPPQPNSGLREWFGVARTSVRLESVFSVKSSPIIIMKH